VVDYIEIDIVTFKYPKTKIKGNSVTPNKNATLTTTEGPGGYVVIRYRLILLIWKLNGLSELSPA